MKWKCALGKLACKYVHPAQLLIETHNEKLSRKIRDPVGQLWGQGEEFWRLELKHQQTLTQYVIVWSSRRRPILINGDVFAFVDWPRNGMTGPSRSACGEKKKLTE